MKNSKNRLRLDQLIHYIFFGVCLICASIIILIVLFIFLKGLSPFTSHKTSIIDFLFGFSYIKGKYGVLGLVINTIFIVGISIIIALPLSVFTALFIVRIAPKKIASIMVVIVELLSAIPSIIFGLFGMAVINPLIRDLATILGFQTAGGVSVLSVILVLVMMITPTITILSITSMKAVSNDLILASLALGATKTQTNFRVVLFGAKGGIFASIILGVGRALGEATAVSMVCGGANTISIGLFSPTGTLTSTMLQGIHESSGLDYDIRFSVGIVLIVLILVSNFILNMVKKKVCKHDK